MADHKAPEFPLLDMVDKYARRLRCLLSLLLLDATKTRWSCYFRLVFPARRRLPLVFALEWHRFVSRTLSAAQLYIQAYTFRLRPPYHRCKQEQPKYV